MSRHRRVPAGPRAIKPTPPASNAPALVAGCAACHGENGAGIDAPLEPKPPILAGQHADYLEQALRSYRNGRRKNAIMAGMALSIPTDADVKVVAAYFATQSSTLATVKSR